MIFKLFFFKFKYIFNFLNSNNQITNIDALGEALK